MADEVKELDDLITRHHKKILADHRRKYDRGVDPFAAWNALLLCHDWGRKIPSWVMGYFVAAAKRLDNVDVHNAEPRKRTALLAEALGFKQPGPAGRGGRPRNANAYRDEDLVSEVFHARQKKGSLKAARIAVAKARGLSVPTVERTWSTRNRRLVPPSISR